MPIRSYLLQDSFLNYHFRRRIPSDLRPVLRRREIKVSLRTTHHKTAFQRAQILAYQSTALFSELRSMKFKGIPPDLKELESSYLVDRFHVKGLRITAGEVSADELSVDSPEDQKLFEASVRALTPTNLAAPTPQPKSQLISELIQEFTEMKVTSGAWNTNSANDHKSSFSLLLQIIGDGPVNDLVYDDEVQFRKTVLTFPANATKRYGRSEQATRKIKADKPKPMAPATARKHFKRIGSLFAWGQHKRGVTHNFFQGMTVVSDTPDSGRTNWTSDELVKIFSLPTYRTGRPKLDWQYWIPLIALHTGMRQNEIVQLDAADVDLTSPIPVFNLRQSSESEQLEAGKRLKTKNSTRVIPIHPMLIQLGFDKYVESRQGHAKLFKIESADKKHGTARPVSRWCSAQFEKLGIAGQKPKKDFHSFRHTLITYASAAGVPEAQIAFIAGHAHREITSRVYTHAILEVLYENLCKINFSKELANVAPWQP